MLETPYHNIVMLLRLTRVKSNGLIKINFKICCFFQKQNGTFYLLFNNMVSITIRSQIKKGKNSAQSILPFIIICFTPIGHRTYIILY